jgi:hypothetical protein
LHPTALRAALNGTASGNYKSNHPVYRKKGRPMMKRLRTTRTTHAFPWYPISGTLAALALLLLAPVAPAGAETSNSSPAPDLGGCQSLQVPAGNELAEHVYADGWQIYRWDGMSWSFVTPAAVLFADAAETTPVGLHYTGPTWESLDGSKVAGTAITKCTPDPSAIPWLLLGAVSNTGPAGSTPVTYIQRLNTVGGTAPTAPGTSAGEVARVPYTAEYYFYRAHP